MPAPSEDAIVKDPRPLNAFVVFPYRIDPFPAQRLFGSQFADIAAGQSHPMDTPPNPLRREP